MTAEVFSIVASERVTQESFIWQKAGWYVFLDQDDEDGTILSAYCVHEATGKIVLLGIGSEKTRTWSEQILMALIKENL